MVTILYFDWLDTRQSDLDNISAGLASASKISLDPGDNLQKADQTDRRSNGQCKSVLNTNF